jgi:hypothetical protein
MEFRPKVIAGTSLSLAMLLVAFALTGCGGSSWGKPTTSSAGSTTSSSASAGPGERGAAEAYFAAMAPVIEKDYQAVQWINQAMTQWQQTYADSDPSTDRQAWNALGLILEQGLPKGQEIVRGYEAITPPEAFRTAHAALLANNRDGNPWAEDLLAAIKANRPISELMPMFDTGPPGPSNAEVLAMFQEAAARVGIELPTKLIDAYSDDTDSGGPSA